MIAAAQARRLVKDGMRSTGARLGLLHIQKVMSGMRQRGVDLSGLRALEVFGYTGERLTKHYAPFVRSLEVWEIDPDREPALRRNLPRATVKITDSYEEIQRTTNKYDFVVIDNFATPSEHFDLFPAVFRVLSDDAVLMMLVLPTPGERFRKLYPHVLDGEHLARRKEFYATDSPERVPLDQVARRYEKLAERNGFTPEWHFFVERRELDGMVLRRIGYHNLVLKLKRARQEASKP